MKNILLVVLLGSAVAGMAPAHAGKCGGGGRGGGGHTGESFADRKLLQRYADASAASSEQAAAAPVTSVTASLKCPVAASPASGDASAVATLDAKGLAAPACTRQP